MNKSTRGNLLAVPRIKVNTPSKTNIPFGGYFNITQTKLQLKRRRAEQDETE